MDFQINSNYVNKNDRTISKWNVIIISNVRCVFGINMINLKDQDYVLGLFQLK